MELLKSSNKLERDSNHAHELIEAGMLPGEELRFFARRGSWIDREASDAN
jgi:hypothetical protein